MHKYLKQSGTTQISDFMLIKKTASEIASPVWPNAMASLVIHSLKGGAA